MFSRRKEKVEITPGDPQFFVRYIGKTQTFIASGKGCTKIPVQRLWDNATEEKKMKKVSLLVTPTGIVMTDLENKDSEFKFDIKNISYCSAEQEGNDKLFAWIHRDKDSKDMFCHVVLCPSKEKSQAIAVVLSRAFQIAYKDWKSSKGRVARKKVTDKIQVQSKESFDKADRERRIRLTNNQVHSNEKSCHSNGHKDQGNSSSCHGNGRSGNPVANGRDNNLADYELSSASSMEKELGEMNIRAEDEDELSFTENNAILDAEEEAQIARNEAVKGCLRGDLELVIQPEHTSP